MKKRLLSRIKSFSRLQIIAIAFLCALATGAVAASVTSYLTNYSWSANTGYIRGGNCTNPNDPSTCDKNAAFAYNVSMDPQTGKISGYAWSSNLGWIDFDPNSCPDSVPGCTSGTYADFAHKNNNGTVPIKGWARACSVFDSGCGGSLASNGSRGDWAGFISLSGTAQDKSSYGVHISSDGKTMSGFAWGGDVIGWVQMNFTVNSHVPECSDKVDNEDPEDDPAPVGDGTKLADQNDPGCHTDGDVNNPKSYDPSDDNETNGPLAAVSNFAGVCIDKKPYLTWESAYANECKITYNTQTSVTTAANSVDAQGSDGQAAEQLSDKNYYVLEQLGTDVTPQYKLSCIGDWGPIVSSKTVTIDLTNPQCSGETPPTQCKDGSTPVNGKCPGDGSGGDKNPQCSDGFDNDHDGYIDWDGGPDGGTPDPGCTSPSDNSEFNAIYEEH